MFMVSLPKVNRRCHSFEPPCLEVQHLFDAICLPCIVAALAAIQEQTGLHLALAQPEQFMTSTKLHRYAL